MSSHFLVDKSLALEARFGGFSADTHRSFPEPGVRAHYGPDRGFTLAHAELDFTIDPVARTVSGRTTLTVQPLPGGLGEVSFDLDQVVVSSVTDGQGAPLRWRYDSGKLAVTGLPPQGGQVVVHTHGRPERGLYFVGPTAAAPDRSHQAWTQCQDEDAHYFWPCIDHPSVKQPLTVRVTAPAGYTVVSNGRLRERAGDTWVWDQVEPIPAYLLTIVVAPLTVVEDQWRGRPVRYLAPAGTPAEVIRRVFHKTPAMIEAFSQRFGVAYPWPRYDQVVVYDFIFGGMENVAATTLTDLVLTDDRAALDQDSDDLISHELAHQWFGDLVTCQDWSQGWLNEGWATYSEHLWKTVDLGQDEADYALFQQMENYLIEDSGRYRRPIVDYRFREPIDLFDRHLYEKGGLVLHTLRTLLGERAFWAGVTSYLERHAHRTVHTRNFQQAMEEASGRNLDGFFQRWVYGAGHPTLAVEVSHEDDLLTVTLTQTQTGESVAEAFAFPLKLTLVTGDERSTLTLPVRERTRAWSLPCAVAPDRVEVDTGFSVLCELSLKAPRGMLIGSLRQDKGVIGRIRAARALGEEGSPAAVAALCQALREDVFWGVRAEVAAVLGKRGGELARQALLDALAEPHPKARKAVVAALAELRHPDVYAALRQLATQGDPSVHVEGEAARALGRLQAPGAVEVCLAVLNRDSWGEVLRARALEGLGASRDPAALPTLLAWTEDQRPNRARAAAAAALGRLADEVEPCRLAAVERLVQLAREAPFRVQMAAVGALGTARDPRGAAVLQHLHDGAGGDGRVMRSAYEALQKINSARSGEGALSSLRRDLEALREENRALRSRLDKLEGTPSTEASGPTSV